MAKNTAAQKEIAEPEIHISIWGIGIGIAVLAAFIYLVVAHLGEVQHYVTLLRNAKPIWLVMALLLQVGTYLCSGQTWNLVGKSAGYTIDVKNLAKLAIEKLSINQLFPTGGIGGDLIVARALKRLGLPISVAFEALIVEVFSYDASCIIVTLTTIGILAAHHDITPILIELLLVFTLVLSVVPGGILFILTHRKWRAPRWIERRKVVQEMRTAIANVSLQRLFARELLVKTTLLQIGIVVLDAATLWVMMQVTQSPITPQAAFAGMVMGAVAGMVSFIPGGIGGFEVGCTTTLLLFGAPIEAALAGTLLLRFFTLWLPLIPGIFFARREILFRHPTH